MDIVSCANCGDFNIIDYDEPLIKVCGICGYKNLIRAVNISSVSVEANKELNIPYTDVMVLEQCGWEDRIDNK